MRSKISKVGFDVGEKSCLITVDNNKVFSFLQNQPDIAWMITPDASAFWWNDTFYERTGKTPADMVDWVWQDYLPLEEIGRVASSMYAALAAKQNWECIYPLLHKDGSYRQLLARSAPLFDKKGNLQYWVGSSTDITDYVATPKQKKLLNVL